MRIERAASFKRDLKKSVRHGCDLDILAEILEDLYYGRPLPSRHRDHRLTDSRNYKDMRECHVTSDWLMIYQYRKDDVIVLVRLGTHSDLF